MRKPSWMERLKYQFDNYMAKGTIALIGGLGVLSVIVIFLVATVVWLLQISPGDGEQIGFWEAAWLSLMRTLDAGTMGGDTGWGFRFAMFVVTLGGVFIISTLIGILTSAVEGKLEELRKGRSKVIEHGHTIILGWSSQVFTIVSELVIANASEKNSCIVILGNKDKVEMEDAIREAVGPLGKTRVVCRSGNPIDIKDLKMVSPQTAKSIIILSQETDNPDAEVIKSLLAIVNSPDRRPEPYHVVVEIRDPKNVEITRMVGRDEVEVIMVGGLISRVIAQTCRQSGLSIIYTELLDFGGDEIYMKEEPALVGKTFGETLMAYDTSSVIGIKPGKGGPRLNPPMDTPIQSGDQMIVIAEDDSKVQLSAGIDPQVNAQWIVTPKRTPSEPEQNILLGWNWRGQALVTEMDHYMPQGSTVHVVSSYAEVQAEVENLAKSLSHTTLTFSSGDTTDRLVLNALNIPAFDHVILLCYSDHMGEQEADSTTLMTLLHLRDISRKSGVVFSITSEMLDVHNRALAEITEADDFIVSENLISLMLAQVSENKYLNAVLEDLFDPEGSEIYLNPVEEYVQTGQKVNFYTVVEAARRRGQVAIGYRVLADARNAAKAYGVVVNPDKSTPIVFDKADKIIVIAED